MNRLGGRPLAGLVFLAWAGAASAGPATDAAIAETGAALEAGNADQALRLAAGALNEPGVTSLQRGRLLLDSGLAHELLGAHDDAMTDFTAAIETHALPPEERAQALLQRGFLLDGMNKLDDAAQDYSAAILLKTPALATALNNRANVYRRQNRLQEARRDYMAALGAAAARPQYAYYGLGQIAEAQKDTQTARQFYAKAVAADPGYLLASQRLAELGGQPEATLAEPDTITLHPPKPVVLKPPPGAGPQPDEKAEAGEDGPIALHPPAAHKAMLPPHKPAAPPPRDPGLRPALDGPAGSTGPQAQLGAWRSEAEAQAGWDRARSRAGDLLDGATAHILRVELPGRGVYFRLRVTIADPARLCGNLKGVAVDCMRVSD